ncbi:DNA-protecting protein DprA [Sphingopyxis sp. DHUNG17]|uniref:DNA-processing protein DprA n=1 Tax=Sphingopyxis jiangsuensis TaxID=2871171 RepID=UPI00191D9ED0|nr:DNA-protecting protein DprA [Sphingopyxis lutea]
MTPAERLARLRLIRTPHVGPVSWHQLMQRFGSGEAALAALPDLVLRGGAGKARIAPAELAEREYARAAELGARHVFSDEDDYPPLLREVEGPPPVLIVRGRTDMLRRPCLAIVGARNASAIACRFARQIASELAARDVTVVSGLARGVDTAAHVGALGGATAAVIASGLDIAFPPENAELQEKIACDQLLIAEQPPGTEPLARHFPARNRIIAGVAHGTLVIEAAPKSGSLITARRAGDYGREVMAVPGSPLDPRAQGCNLLIREGATLVQTVDDVLEALGPIDARMVREPARPFVAVAPAHDGNVGDRDAVAQLLGPTPVAVDELVRQSGRAAADVQLVLLELELAGRVTRHAGARVSLA